MKISVQSTGHIWFSLCLLYQDEPSNMNQRLSFSISYPTLFLLPILLMNLKYQTLYIWMGTFSGSILLPLLVIFSLELCISWMALSGMLLLHATWFYILTVKWSQHVHFFAYMCSKAGSKEVYNVLMLKLLYPW